MERKYKSVSVQPNANGAVFNYVLGITNYGEMLSKGIYKATGWNGSGFAVKPGEMTNTHDGIADLEENCAFILEVDGQSLISHWELIDVDEKENDGVFSIRTLLRHKVRPVDVTVCTKIDGSNCMTRWIEITNTSDRCATITRLAPLSGMLENTFRWRQLLKEKAESPYRLGYFEDASWSHEGLFKWHDLYNDCHSFGGRYTRNRHRHPFCVLENRAKGTCFAMQIAYSGGYRFSFDFRADYNHEFNMDLQDCNLAYVCEIDGTKPLRVMDPGETVVSPEVLISMVNGDLNDATYAMHKHIRNSFMDKPFGREESHTGLWNIPNDDSWKKLVDDMAENNQSILYIDAAWYYPLSGTYVADSPWNKWTGNWTPDPDRFPQGIPAIVDYCHSKGIKFGLWMEPERLGEIAAQKLGLDKADYDKFITDFTDSKEVHIDGKVHRYYNLGDDTVMKYIEDQIAYLIESCKIDFFRLDHNELPTSYFGYNMKDGYMESTDMRYNENFNKMFSNLREKFPNVVFENCSGGGGRTDLGCMRNFEHTWSTDHAIAPRDFANTNGLLMCLPPEMLDNRTLMTSMASLEYRMFLLVFGCPGALFNTAWVDNEEYMVLSRRMTDIFYSFVRPMHKDCKVYHHTPSFDDCEPKGVGILEEASEDKTRVMLGVFALSDAQKEERVYFKGVDAGKKYKVTTVSNNESFEVSGYDLKYTGLHVFINSSLNAELFLAEAK